MTTLNTIDSPRQYVVRVAAFGRPAQDRFCLVWDDGTVSVWDERTFEYKPAETLAIVRRVLAVASKVTL